MYLAFDVGTTSVKTAAFDGAGRLLAKSIQEYALATPEAGRYEVEPEVYWRAVRDGFRETLRGVDARAVRAICGCSQGETVIALDQNDRSVRPAIVWLDTRAGAETEEIKARVSEDEYYRATGCVAIEPVWTLPKIAWIRKREPAIFRRVAKLLLVADYIDYLLTGRFLSTPNLLQSTGLYDILSRRYWPATVAPLGVEGMLPEVVESGTVVGSVRPEVADDLGLRRSVVVIKGAMDQGMSAVGAGNIRSAVVTETTGTALAIGVTADSVSQIHTHRLAYQPHVLPGRYLILPYAQTSGVIYKWFRDVFGSEAYEELNSLAAAVPAGSDGLVLLPFFAGAYVPENDMRARGVWYGMTLSHTKGHFARSIQESVGFMLRRILELVAAANIGIDEVRSMGGAARSELWLQIKADICGIPMVRMQEEETSTLGCALVAAVATGEHASPEAAVAAMVRTGKRFEPDPARRPLYDRRFALYRDLYESLAPVYRAYAEGGHP
jgi:xylulokinase